MNEETNKKSKIAEREEAILKYWRENRIFERTLEKKPSFWQRIFGRKEFVFYDGPPFATGLPHYGHILAGTIKDVIPRFKTMRGFRVPRRWGWDCHGLPVENEVEKELGFATKKDIENYGIGKFNARAKETVMRYADDWRRIIPRTGRFVDMENDYRTMDSSYTESVWWVFKTLYEKGLIYEGFKSMHLCPRCETTLSNFEVTQNYKELTDTAAFVKFPLNGLPNTYVVAWTTTPWTLPGNVALAVHKERDYAFVEITASNAPTLAAGDVYLIGANEKILRRVFGQERMEFDPIAKVGSFLWDGAAVSFSVKKGVAGRRLIGQTYQPIFDYYASSVRYDPKSEKRFNLSIDSRLNLERGWRIYGADFVTEEDGTGIVHIAPAFGEDDYQLAVKERIPFIQHVATDGTFKKETGELAGLPAKPKGNPRETDEKINAFLASRGFLLRSESYTHDYPHCWRCETPLLNYAAPSWFVKVSAFRDRLSAENKNVKWVPREIGEYRFGNWLAAAKDWAISRSRFWGAPLPVWMCERCGAVKVAGSLDEIRAGSGERLTKIILVRHGESVKNTKHVFDDSPNAFPLTREGKREAKESARRIKRMGGADAIYSSPVRRTRETAAIIGAALGKEVMIEEDLREVDSGEWDGKREDDPSLSSARAERGALSEEAFYKDKRGTTGESWEEVEKRMSSALARIIAKHRGETVLLVSHEGPLIYLLKSIGHFSADDVERFDRKNLLGGYAKPNVIYLDSLSQKVFDTHRPFIDGVFLNCERCAASTGTGKGLMKRVPEVFDCWFESGAMPYGQAHYPFERDDAFEPLGGWFNKMRGFPADFIAEGLDQTRGWFYSLLVLGVGLFDRSPYRAVVVNGIILAEDGTKMSKRLKNYPDPLDIVARYGADALRYYLLSSPAVRGEELRFSERGVDEVAKKIFNRLDNVLQFYLLYSGSLNAKRYTLNASHVLDRWIAARLNQLVAEVTRALEAYELDKAARPLGDFVDDLSTWYLRRSRERIKSEVREEKEAALATLGFVLRELSKIMAPFAPFFAEYLYQAIQDTNIRPSLPLPLFKGEVPSLRGEGVLEDEGCCESVHLEYWPIASNVNGQMSNVLKEMEEVRKVVSLGLEARAKANIKVRQPLASLKIRNPKSEIRNKPEFLNLIKEEINIKEIIFDATLQKEVELDTMLTPELKDEGAYRELVRFVQDMRKRQGFSPGEFGTLTVGATGPSRRFIEQHQRELSRAASLKNVEIADSLLNGESFHADEILFSLVLVK